MPGDPLMNIIGEEQYYFLMSRNPEALEELRTRYTLDGSMLVQYGNYVSRLICFDFGYSYSYGMLVSQIVLKRLKWTLMLTVPSIVIAAVFGAYLGLRCGWRQGRFEKVLTPFFFFLNSVPSYCIGILFLYYIAFLTGLFPISGMARAGTVGWGRFIDILWHLVLPLTVLVIVKTAYNFLIMKNSVLTVKHEDYIVTAKSKGLDEKTLRKRHLQKNAMVPYLTSVFMQFGYAMTGVMTLEIVFSWQGMGKLMSNAASAKDYPILQLSFLILCLCVMFFNFMANVISATLDPRIREGGEV